MNDISGKQPRTTTTTTTFFFFAKKTKKNRKASSKYLGRSLFRGCVPATALKLNYFIVLFQGFYQHFINKELHRLMMATSNLNNRVISQMMATSNLNNRVISQWSIKISRFTGPKRTNFRLSNNINGSLISWKNLNFCIKWPKACFVECLCGCSKLKLVS